MKFSYNENLDVNSKIVIVYDGLNFGMNIKCSVQIGSPPEYAWSVKSCKQTSANIELEFSSLILSNTEFKVKLSNIEWPAITETNKLHIEVKQRENTAYTGAAIVKE